MKRKYTINWDDRENKELQFPATLTTLDDSKLPTRDAKVTVQLETHKCRFDREESKMKKGDYYLEGFEAACVIEKKYCLDEIATNCCNPHRRRNFIEELDYLNDRCQFPVLLMLGTHRSILRKTTHTPYPGVPVAALMRLLLERNIRMETMSSETLPARQAAGKWAAHLLISGAIVHATTFPRFKPK